MEHPLKVYFPLPGRYHVLSWRTHNQGGHLILARSSKALEQTARHVFLENYTDSYDSVIIDSLFLIEMVAPPETMCQQATIKAHQEEVKDFLREICSKLFTATKDTELPKNFIRCDEYRSQYDDKPGEDELKHHYCCDNCFGRVRLAPSIEPEQFFQQYHRAWRQENPQPKQGQIEVAYSQAELARDDEELWVGDANFGHHSSGSSLVLLEKDDYDPALFYCRKLEELDKSKLQAILDEIGTEYKEKKQQKNKALRDKREQEERQEHEKILRFFGKKS